MRIQKKFVTVLFFLSILPLAIIGAVAYRNGKNAIEESLGSSFRQTAHLKMYEVDRGLYEVYSNVESWARLGLMQEVITNDIDSKISSFLMDLRKKHRSFSSINVLSSEGEVVASSDFKLLGRDFKEEDFYKNTIDGEIYVGDVALDKISKSWVVTFSFPIEAKFEEDKILGVFCAKWKADEIATLAQLGKVEEERYNRQVMIMRRDGLVISASDHEKGSVFNRNLVRAGLKSALLATQGKTGYLIDIDEDNKRVLIGYDHSRGYRGFSGLGWAAFITGDVKAIFAPVRRLKIIIFGVEAGIGLLVLLLSLIVAKRMTLPILKISRVAKCVAQGDFERRINFRSSDEVGQLAQSFNKMIDDLRDTTVSKHYVDDIIKSMMDSLIVISPEGKIKTVNAAALKSFGYKQEELIEKDVDILFPEAEREALLEIIKLENLVEEDQLRDYESICKTKDGKNIPVLFNAATMKDRDGNIIGIVCVLKDITERKRAEEDLKNAYSKLKEVQVRLVQSAKMSALGQLAGGVAHELNNPLGGILGYAQYAKERIDVKKDGNFTSADVKTWAEYIGYIEQAAQRCKTIVQNLLKFARGSKSELEPVEINSILDDTINFIRHQLDMNQVEVDREFDNRVPIIMGNANQLQQVFTNILINAQQAMPEGGKVRVVSKYIHAENGKPCSVEVNIRDNGCGITKENLDEIFQPFFTTKSVGEGTGLGLSVSYGIIKKHGGEITCESTVGRGTSFTVKLPVDNEEKFSPRENTGR